MNAVCSFMKISASITKSMSNPNNMVLARSGSLWFISTRTERQSKNMRTAKQLLETYLAALSAGEVDKTIALFADDGAVEFPYFVSVGLPTRFQGPEALKQLFGPVVVGAENFKFKNIKIFPGEDDNHVSGEYEVDAVIKKTGRPYRQLYGGRLIAENGKIKLLREFCDTVVVARAMLPNGVKDLVQ